MAGQEGSPPGLPHITVTALDAVRHPLAAPLRRCFERSRRGGRTLDAALLAMPGMSGWRYREFINALIGAVADPRYLEVGSWMGSTLCAAIAGNRVRATAIDNWSQFGGPVREFFSNLACFHGPEAAVSVLTRDFRAVRFDAIGQHNVYLYDGPHDEADQFDGISLALPALDQDFILIVDDWNLDWVRNGTHRAMRQNNLSIGLTIEVRSTLDNTHPAIWGPKSAWHNGYFMAALSKPSSVSV